MSVPLLMTSVMSVPSLIASSIRWVQMTKVCKFSLGGEGWSDGKSRDNDTVKPHDDDLDDLVCVFVQAKNNLCAAQTVELFLKYI